MSLTPVTLGTFIDRALLELRSPSEVGHRVVLAGSISASDTELTLADASAVQTSDRLEFGSELLLVTAKTSDPIPVLTVARGYFGSPAATHAAGDLGETNPTYPRIRVAEAIRRSFARLEALGLPLIQSDTFNRETDLRYVILPAETREVLRVSYIGTNGKWLDLDRWEHVQNVPTGKVASGQMLAVPRIVMDDDDLEVVYRTPYRWSSYPVAAGETDTMSMQEGTEDLPAVYAAAWLVGAREISRQELDVATEWNQGEPSRGGVSMSLLRLKWQDFYRALDEASRLVPLPRHRPYVKMPRLR